MNLEMMHHPLIEAVGAALLHSLWQGGLVVGGLYIALRFYRDAIPGVRYALCSAALLLLFLLPVSTGVQIYLSNQASPGYYPANQEMTSIVTGSTAELPTTNLESVAAPVASRTSLDNMQRAAWAWHPIAVGLWLVGVILLSLHWVKGLFGVYRLRRTGQAVDDGAIQSLFNSLVSRLGITRRVRLMATVHLDQPLVIGWIRPVVLLPLSMITQLPKEQVEAILIHELVHVRRHDYLVLVLQSVIEILFFYHPAVWWVSRQMRIEREYCCDDLVTQTLGDKLVYVTALANMESKRGQRLALGANDGNLVSRVQRIVEQRARESQEGRFSWLGVGMLLLACCVLASACFNWGQPDLSGSPEELYQLALAEVQESKYTEAVPYAEKAAEQGHLCSMWLLSEMYEDKPGAHTGEDGTRYLPVKWGYKSEETSLQWAHAVKAELLNQAEAGDNKAMLMVAVGYKDNFDLGSYSRAFEESDSLADMWIDRAAEANNAYAIRWQATKIAREQKDFVESDKLFARAAELGDEAAYYWWSGDYGDRPDPQRYFEILDEGLQKENHGAYDRLQKTLETLNKQVELGNEDAMVWKAVADSFRFEERLQEKVELGEAESLEWIFPEFSYREQCGLEWDMFYYADGKSRWWVDKNSSQ